MTEISRIVHRGAATIGSFRCRPGDATFRDSGPTRGHLLVFPREPVMIRHAGRRAVVADPSVTMIYNQHQEYTRTALGPAGDRCEWFAFDAAAVLEARRDRGDDLERPFGNLTHVASDAACYLLARRAFEHASAADVDAAWLDEVCATLLDRTLRRAHDAPTPAPTIAHRDLADATRTAIARHYAEPWSLTDLSAGLGVSAFHLARVFRAVTGTTIHAFRTQLRMRAALERIADQPLATVALEVGYANHSHFTQVFRATFGIAPSKISTARRAVRHRR